MLDFSRGLRGVLVARLLLAALRILGADAAGVLVLFVGGRWLVVNWAAKSVEFLLVARVPVSGLLRPYALGFHNFC